ncbi:MAG: AAA family ATPase [Anaerolineales bacterium]|nr:AAA family ATPase [Anaerolineales bacterium]
MNLRAARHVPTRRPGHARLLWMALLALLGALLRPTPAGAQTPSLSYWEYAVASTPTQVATADVNADGIAEILLATAENGLELLGADGRFRWRYPTPTPIRALGTVNVDGPAQPDREIVVGLADQLILLSADGTRLWQTPIQALTPPPSLLTASSEGVVQMWQAQYAANPTRILSFDADGDGREEILLLLASGQIQLFAATGEQLWQGNRNNNPLVNTSAHVLVADLDGDGASEVILGYFNPSRRFSRLVRFNGAGVEQWDIPVSGRITALSSIQFDPQAPTLIAVGTSLGNVDLYQPTGRREWPRTVNKAVTALTAVSLPTGPALAAGTSSGSIILFSREGRRLWTNHLDPSASRPVQAISAAAGADLANQPLLMAALAPTGAGDVLSVLLDSDGRQIKSIDGVDEQGLSRLLDVNGDGQQELILANFPALRLVGLGIGASETALEWSQSLRATPLSSLVVDFESDGVDELLIGTDDGHLFRLDNAGFSEWIIMPEGAITHLAALPATAVNSTRIALARTVQTESGDTRTWLAVRHANGERVWEEILPGPVTQLQVVSLRNQGEPDIVVSTETGHVLVFSASGTEQLRQRITGAIRHLVVLQPNARQTPGTYELVVANDNDLYKIGPADLAPRRIAAYEAPIRHVQLLDQPGNELADRLLVLTANGFAYALNWRGILLPPWPIDLGAAPLFSIPAADVDDSPAIRPAIDAFLIAMEGGSVLRLQIENNRPAIIWRLRGLEEISNLHWSDVDGDQRQDITISIEDRKVQIFAREPSFITELTPRSTAFDLAVLNRGAEQSSDLVIMAENGQVELYRAQENRPPLLINPNTSVRQGQYGISVEVQDIEADTVRIQLQVQDPNTLAWETQDERVVDGGQGQAPFLLANPPAFAAGVRYRFAYQDPFHNGFVQPTPGPQPIAPSPLQNVSRTVLSVLTVLAALVVVIMVRQAQSPPARARRFHRRLRQHPTHTLRLLDSWYSFTGGSSDFLLYLTSQARQAGDWLIASLADGLFLLADRPLAALSILNGALDEAAKRELPWEGLSRWQRTYKMGQALVEAPAITDLSLLHPQLVELLAQLEAEERWSALESLRPVLSSIRDSERVELVSDRLFYLNEAAAQLDDFDEPLQEFDNGIEKTLARAIAGRWAGMISARAEELRGRAELLITLKTKRLAPNGRNDVAVEIVNNGRASAEQVLAVLEEMPAYAVCSPPQIVPLIPPGRSRQVSFTIEPKVSDRFRIAMTLTYSDRQQQERTAAFGDMVHMLPPARDFKRIANPYIPGSPLRRDSTLFYGRREIFNFIAENLGPHSQRNVLILIGQRRTGKTSTLLQLEHALPPHLYPVYIDCQSLGVTPGLAAFFNELAWLIGDALSGRGVQVDVPEAETWEENPTVLFQREFLPAVQALLPPESTLLLVFDEFESFESLVNDGILPPSFFPYLRHLMQHSSGLGFIFVGTQRLEEMGADYWSVLFNIALYQKIGYLSRASATRLIVEPVADALVYDDLALDKILRVTAGHPYFLQLVCYTLVKRANAQRSAYVTISDVNAALDEMLKLGEVHFAYLWQRSSAAERAILTAVAHLLDADLPFHPHEVLDALAPYGIKPPPMNVTTALNSLVERDIMQAVTEEGQTLYALRIGLVGLWVAQNKGLSKLLTERKAWA